MSASTPWDGRHLVEVRSDDSGERFTLRVRSKHARLGTTVFVEFEDKSRESFGVVGLLEPRRCNICDAPLKTDPTRCFECGARVRRFDR